MTPQIVVWFKRDLRVVDHEPLDQAVREGKVLPLVCYRTRLLGNGIHLGSSVVLPQRLSDISGPRTNGIGTTALDPNR